MRKDVHEGLWSDSEYSIENYQTEMPDDNTIRGIEKELGYKFPASYLAFMRCHNGGLVKRDCCPYVDSSTGKAGEVFISGFIGIGGDKPNTLMGTFGSRFWIEEWEYPDIGIAICDCPSAGHDMIFLDYRVCGPEGEPCVVHVDQELDYEITRIADSFDEFVDKLTVQKEDEINTNSIVFHSTPKLDKLIEQLHVKHPEWFKKG